MAVAGGVDCATSAMSGDVYAYSVKSGQPLWKLSLPGTYSKAHPVYDGGLLYVAAKNATLYALNAQTGAVVGQVALPSSSPGPRC